MNSKQQIHILTRLTEDEARRRKISTAAEIYFVNGGTMAIGSFAVLLMELLMDIGRVV